MLGHVLPRIFCVTKLIELFNCVAIRCFVSVPANPSISRMSQARNRSTDHREFIKKLMLAPENEIVIFVFASDHRSGDMAEETSGCSDNKVIRALKSQLVSPVFERMFRADQNPNTIVMDDEVTFDQYEVFKLFISILHNLSSVSR